MCLSLLPLLVEGGPLTDRCTHTHTRDSTDANESATDQNTIVFKLQVACTRKPDASGSATETEPDKLYDHHEVLSSHLEWQPQGEQENVFTGDHPAPAPTNPNIVLAKLRPGQVVDMELHAIKGVGQEHAKWSPVGAFGWNRFW